MSKMIKISEENSIPYKCFFLLHCYNLKLNFNRRSIKC